MTSGGAGRQRLSAGNGGQGAAASLAFLAFPATGNLQLAESKGGARVRIPLSPPPTYLTRNVHTVSSCGVLMPGRGAVNADTIYLRVTRLLGRRIRRARCECRSDDTAHAAGNPRASPDAPPTAGRPTSDPGPSGRDGSVGRTCYSDTNVRGVSIRTRPRLVHASSRSIRRGTPATQSPRTIAPRSHPSSLLLAHQERTPSHTGWRCGALVKEAENRRERD
jgi:hypothetical protein